MEHAPHNVRVVRRGEARLDTNMSRREFVKKIGAGSVSAAAIGVGAKEYVDYRGTQEADEVERNETIDDLVEEVVAEGESASRYFDSAVAEEIAVMAADGDLAIEHIDLIHTILEHGQMPGIESEIVRDRLERMLPAIAFTESRFDVEALNNTSGTFGPFQLRPIAWEELANDGETKESIEDQVQVAARLLEQSYQHITGTCKQELESIKERFFNDDSDAFEEYFLLPTIINSYFAGMGTMEEVVKTFVEDFKTADELRSLSPEGQHYLTDRDVFTGMSHAARGLQWSKDYRDESAKYTYKPYAAYKVMTESLDQFVKGSASNQDA